MFGKSHCYSLTDDFVTTGNVFPHKDEIKLEAIRSTEIKKSCSTAATNFLPLFSILHLILYL